MMAIDLKSSGGPVCGRLVNPAPAVGRLWRRLAFSRCLSASMMRALLASGVLQPCVGAQSGRFSRLLRCFDQRGGHKEALPPSEHVGLVWSLSCQTHHIYFLEI